MKCWIPLLALLSSPLLADPDLDALVGEWAFGGQDCGEARMVFDFEGRFDLRLSEDGRWKVLGGGSWKRQGDLILTESDGRSERFSVDTESRDRIVLVSHDGTVDREAGVGYLELDRCPAY